MRPIRYTRAAAADAPLTPGPRVMRTFDLALTGAAGPAGPAR